MRYFLGNRQLVEAYVRASGFACQPRLPELDGTVVYFGWDGAVRGALAFGDPIRPEAVGLCAALRARGIRTVLLSGDARVATARAANAIGADRMDRRSLA